MSVPSAGHHRRGDDLIPRSDVQRSQSHQHRIGGRTDCQGRRRTDERSEFLLESPGLRAGGQSTGMERVNDFGDLCFINVGKVKGDGVTGHI